MRMTAAGIIMAQLGMLVPSKGTPGGFSIDRNALQFAHIDYRLVPIDSILTHMGPYQGSMNGQFPGVFDIIAPDYPFQFSFKTLRDAMFPSLVVLEGAFPNIVSEYSPYRPCG